VDTATDRMGRELSTAPEGSDTGVVRMRGASATLGGRTIWSEVDINVAAGEFVAVLGPNGSGKSTLLRTLLGLTPVGGDVEVLGERPGRMNGHIAYVAQRRAFDANLRVRGVDIVRLGLDGARWGVPMPWLTRLLWPRRFRLQQRLVTEAIERVGGSEYARRPIGQCSGGQQQRLLIAQALLRRPRLMLLDEPLDSLDVPSQAGISALVRDIAREQGTAVIMVAHDVNPILPYLDRVIYFAGGTAVSGTPHQVITAEQLSTLYGMPVEVLRDSGGRVFVVGQPDVPPEHRGGIA
jgi:zinc/manganese transport system ATP-binding protein